MNSLQNYFGIALRQNTSTVAYMKKAIAAVLVHDTENENKGLRHMYCPKGPDSWCKWQNDHSYEPKLSLPSAVKHEVHRSAWSDARLLNKCLHGLTQNVNEILNGMIWDRCPKSILVGKCFYLVYILYFDFSRRRVFLRHGNEWPGFYIQYPSK